mmetsp:Transcript_65136/g.155514  ORF Transcript_65136/g.155514 Transcript_65136/m.155514 type:complete len:227 (+) Transcript_65136:162-842(+)
MCLWRLLLRLIALDLRNDHLGRHVLAGINQLVRVMLCLLVPISGLPGAALRLQIPPSLEAPSLAPCRRLGRLPSLLGHVRLRWGGWGRPCALPAVAIAVPVSPASILRTPRTTSRTFARSLPPCWPLLWSSDYPPRWPTIASLWYPTGLSSVPLILLSRSAAVAPVPVILPSGRLTAVQSFSRPPVIAPSAPVAIPGVPVIFARPPVGPTSAIAVPMPAACWHAGP